MSVQNNSCSFSGVFFLVDDLFILSGYGVNDSKQLMVTTDTIYIGND